MTSPSSPTSHALDEAAAAVRIAMPHHLRRLAQVSGEVVVQTTAPATLGAALDALEVAHPTLGGTIRDRATRRRRPMIRIYAAGEDLSDAPADTELPGPVAAGQEPLRLVGAIAGG
jgi:sulfur-carrier protein